MLHKKCYRFVVFINLLGLLKAAFVFINLDYVTQYNVFYSTHVLVISLINLKTFKLFLFSIHCEQCVSVKEDVKSLGYMSNGYF